METFINCSKEEGEELKKCIEAIAYSPEDTVIATNHQGKIQVECRTYVWVIFIEIITTNLNTFGYLNDI